MRNYEKREVEELRAIMDKKIESNGSYEEILEASWQLVAAIDQYYQKTGKENPTGKQEARLGV